MQEILNYLKEHGEQLASEIATGTGIPLADVHRSVSDLSAQGEVVTCHVVRFNDGKKSVGMLYRAAGHVRRSAPGRKPKDLPRGSAGERNPE